MTLARWARSMLAVALGSAWLAGCAPARPTNSEPDPIPGDPSKLSSVTRLGFSLRYAIDSMEPPLEFSLRIDARGNALLASSRGSSTGLVGDHLVVLTDAQCRSLAALVDDHDFDDGPTADAQGSGSIDLERGGRDEPISLATNDPDTRALREALDAIMAEALLHPLAAIRVSIEVRDSGAFAVLENVGTASIDVLLFDPKDPAFWARVRVGSAPPGGGGPSVPRSDLEKLAADGALPSGVTTFAGGQKLAIPLGGIEVHPTDDLEVAFWRPGPGLSRRSLVARSSR